MPCRLIDPSLIIPACSVGDATLAAEAARLVLKACTGDKQVDVVTPSRSTSTQTVPPNSFRTSVSTRDLARRYFLFINDCEFPRLTSPHIHTCSSWSESAPSGSTNPRDRSHLFLFSGVATSGVAADCNPNTMPANAADVTLTVNLASWGIPAGTILPVSVAGTNSMGEVQALVPLSAAGTITINVPSASVVLVTGQLSGQQSVTVVTPTEDATIGPTMTGATNAETLTVSTSSTADHSTTRMTLLKFPNPSAAANAGLTAAILELTLAQAPAQTMILMILGAACDTAWTESTVSWTAAGTWATNTTIPVNAPITLLSQNFQYIDATTVVAGHLTIPAGAAVGTVFRVDVGDYVGRCPGQSVSFAISRRLRNPFYTGNVIGNIPADTLSGGASALFYSAESTTGTGPQLRLLVATSIATGAMSAALPGRVASTPAGRRILADTRAQDSIAASLSQTLGVPVIVSVASYALYVEVVIQGLSLASYRATSTLQAGLVDGFSDDLANSDVTDIFVKSVSQSPLGPNGVMIAFLIDGYVRFPQMQICAGVFCERMLTVPPPPPPPRRTRRRMPGSPQRPATTIA